MKRTILFFALILFPFRNNPAQIKYDKSFYGGLFYLSEFIASSEFDVYKEVNDDLSQINFIYKKAIEFFDGDISEALLALTFTCLPFDQIKVRFFFGSKIIFPLPSPPKKIFNKKLSNLPSKLFFDSPKSNFGDKDKLAHFFGNAFLRYNFGFFNLSKFMGIFVENVEEGLFLEGGFSNRDIIVNHLGELFAESIKKNKNLLPSDILKIYQLLFLRISL
ncbi:MAG: hypothetical protein AB1432_10290 [Bacteroidota bacterium]